MMNIGIVDDDNIFLENFKEMIVKAAQGIAMISNVKCFNDGINHMEELLNCDIVFFDIEMPQINGLDLAEELGKHKNGQELPLVVFVTSRDNYVYTALSYYPFSFIRKSCVGKEVEKCLTQAKKRIDMLRMGAHVIQLNGGKKLVPTKEIMYVEKVDNEIIYKGKNAEYGERITMNKVMEKLDNMGFIRIHEGFAVNVEHITCMETTKVNLSNGEFLVLSRKYRDSAKRSYWEWLNRKARREIW